MYVCTAGAQEQQRGGKLWAAHRHAACLGASPRGKEYGHCAAALREPVRK